MDDDEVLAEVSGEVFLLLVDGETYSPSPQQIPNTQAVVLGTSTAEEVLQPSDSCSGTEIASGSASDPEAYASHKSSNPLCTYVMYTCQFVS